MFKDFLKDNDFKKFPFFNNHSKFINRSQTSYDRYQNNQTKTSNALICKYCKTYGNRSTYYNNCKNWHNDELYKL